MNQLRIYDDYGGSYLSIDLPYMEDDRPHVQKLLKLELLGDGGKIHDTLYVQLEISKGERGTSKEVLDRLASRDAPFTHIEIRR